MPDGLSFDFDAGGEKVGRDRSTSACPRHAWEQRLEDALEVFADVGDGCCKDSDDLFVDRANDLCELASTLSDVVELLRDKIVDARTDVVMLLERQRVDGSHSFEVTVEFSDARCRRGSICRLRQARQRAQQQVQESSSVLNKTNEVLETQLDLSFLNVEAPEKFADLFLAFGWFRPDSDESASSWSDTARARFRLLTTLLSESLEFGENSRGAVVDERSRAGPAPVRRHVEFLAACRRPIALRCM